MLSKNTNAQDLTVQTDSGILNIRVLILVKTKKGYIFEHNREGYYFAIGGRVKFNENSRDAAYRELAEEIDRNDLDLELKGIIENFFTMKGKQCHEINFVYYADFSGEINLEKLHSDHRGFVYIKPSELGGMDIKPKVLKKFLKSEELPFIHEINIDESLKG